MDFNQLRQEAKKGSVHVCISSYEGGIYLLEVKQEGKRCVITEKSSDKPLIYRCIERARDDLHRIGIEHPELVHDNVADEMVGFQPHYNESEEMRLRL